MNREFACERCKVELPRSWGWAFCAKCQRVVCRRCDVEESRNYGGFETTCLDCRGAEMAAEMFEAARDGFGIWNMPAAWVALEFCREQESNEPGCYPLFRYHEDRGRDLRLEAIAKRLYGLAIVYTLAEAC